MSNYFFSALSCPPKQKSVPSKEPLPLVQFSNGNLRITDNISFDLYKSKEARMVESKRKRIMVASTNRLQYSAQNFTKNKCEKSSICLLKVGIINKKAKAMRIYDADLFHFKPLIKFHNETETMENHEKSRMEKVDDLACTFGSKRKKMATESRLRFAPKESQLKSAAEHIDNSIIEEITTKQDPIKLDPNIETIPPQNKSARYAVEVYNLYDIISEEEFQAIQSEENTFLCVLTEDLKRWKDDDLYCDFIIKYVQSKLRCITAQTARLLCYFHYMISLLKLGWKDLKKKDPVPNVPEPYKKNLMDKFFETSQADGKLNRSFPQKMKDKLVAYAIVLALYIDNFNVDALLISTSLKTPLSRITNIAYALGCHVGKNKGEKVIELKLPLYKHVESTFRQRKK